ncbi:MAG: type II toxin-antitoxin system VapC family toxin [Mycolicibacterium cosmeticum]|nr:type II toxin-antitoxin system VapC family toxin [Mycolicibacterium cosmeticum]
MIVLDASAAVSALLNGGQARRLVSAEVITAPHLVDSEVLSALRRQAALGALTLQSARKAVEVWARLGVNRYAAAPLLERVWELRENVTAYDGMYVALAEALDCPLVTLDARLSSAPGIRCAITVIPD